MARRTVVVVLSAVLLVAFSLLPAAGQGATVEKDFFTSGPVWTPLGIATITNSNWVVTPSGNWVITVQAQLDDPEAAPSRTMRWTEANLGLGCWDPGQERINMVINPSGHVTLTCRSN